MSLGAPSWVDDMARIAQLAHTGKFDLVSTVCCAIRRIFYETCSPDSPPGQIGTSLIAGLSSMP